MLIPAESGVAGMSWKGKSWLCRGVMHELLNKRFDEQKQGWLAI